MQCLEVSGAVRLIYGSLGVKRSQIRYIPNSAKQLKPILELNTTKRTCVNTDTVRLQQRACHFWTSAVGKTRIRIRI